MALSLFSNRQRNVYPRVVDLMSTQPLTSLAMGVLYGSSNTAARVWNHGGPTGKRILDLSVLTIEALPEVDAMLHPNQGVQEMLITAFEDGDLDLIGKLPTDARPGLKQWECPTLKQVTVTLFARPDEWVLLVAQLIRENPTVKNLTISAPQRPSTPLVFELCAAIEETGTITKFTARNRVLDLISPLVPLSYEVHRLGHHVSFLEDWIVLWCMTRMIQFD